MISRRISRMMHDLAACVHLQSVVDENGTFTNAAIRHAYGNAQSSNSRIMRLIELGLVEKAGHNRYRLID